MQRPQLHLKVLKDSHTWCCLGPRRRLMGIKETNSICSPVSSSRSSLTQSNHHSTECSNLLVCSSAASRHLAGYMATLKNIISTYKKTEQFKMTSYLFKNDKYLLSTFAATGQNYIKLQVGINTCNCSLFHAVLLLFWCHLSCHGHFLPFLRLLKLQATQAQAFCLAPHAIALHSQLLSSWGLGDRSTSIPLLHFCQRRYQLIFLREPRVDVPSPRGQGKARHTRLLHASW